jgi:tetratricopeptide (TPR) repeat protein
LEATAATASVLADERARQAMELLLPLLQSADLNQSQVQATGAASFRAALALEDDEAIRSLFGVLESRAPRAPISESELLQVARTFSRAGDLEYARRAWNAVLNLRFLAEVGAGEQLVDLGMPAEGLRLVHDLTTAYPDIPSVTESVFNLPQMLVRQAEAQPDNPEGRFTGRRFRRTADRWLSEYLIRYGDEERASQAALQQMHIASELEEWGRLITLGPAFRRMYDDSNLADSFDFMTAYGHQREGDYASARRLYERIAEEMYGTQWSSDRDRARLALAQIAHAEGDLGAAIESYRAAGNGFPDARAALTVLESAELRVPAVVDAATGRGLTIPIRVRAVDSVEVWAYAVDLERLFLRENQVRAVENILLSGIPPIVEESFDLPMNFGALAEHEISLPLREAGAYLVLVRSETTLASTLAIVSDLQLDIVEDPRANALHIGVTDRNGQPLEGATVRVAYPGGTPMTAETDLRGLVAHNGFNATAHVLARAGEQYAVYRGGEDSGFDAPSQINTGWGHAPAPASLMEGQQMRMQEVQESNIIEYEQNVFRNRRSISNFDLE